MADNICEACGDPDCDACYFARHYGITNSRKNCINSGVDQRPYLSPDRVSARAFDERSSDLMPSVTGLSRVQ